MNLREYFGASAACLVTMAIFIVPPCHVRAQPAPMLVGITSASVPSLNGIAGQNVGAALIAVTENGEWFYQRTSDQVAPQPAWPAGPWILGGNIFLSAGGAPDRVVAITNAGVPPTTGSGCCDNAVVAITQNGDWYYQRVFLFLQASQPWPNEAWHLGGNIAGGVVRTQSVPWGGIKGSYRTK